jgi:hypothetical protein
VTASNPNPGGVIFVIYSPIPAEWQRTLFRRPDQAWTAGKKRGRRSLKRGRRVIERRVGRLDNEDISHRSTSNRYWQTALAVKVHLQDKKAGHLLLLWTWRTWRYQVSTSPTQLTRIPFVPIAQLHSSLSKVVSHMLIPPQTRLQAPPRIDRRQSTGPTLKLQTRISSVSFTDKPPTHTHMDILRDDRATKRTPLPLLPLGPVGQRCL